MKKILLALVGAVFLFFFFGFLSAIVRSTNEKIADIFVWCAIFAPIALLISGFIFRKSKSQKLWERQQKEAQMLMERQQQEAAERYRQATMIFRQKIDLALADGRLTDAEARDIVGYAQANGISLNSPDGILLRKAAYLQTILDGRPCKAPMNAPAGIVWEPGERFLYAWPNTSVAEYQTQKRYVAGTAGVSVRVCKGVYVRSGGIRGHVETSKGFERLGSGMVAVTNRNVYVMAPVEPFKAPLKKLVSVRAFQDGVVLSFTGRQKMLALDANDHWFMANILMNAQHVS